MIRYWKPEGKAIWKSYPAEEKLTKRARYCTVLALSEEWDEDKTITYAGPLYFDFDGELDPVLNNVRTALRTLELNYEVPLDWINCFFTGGRGFHLSLNMKLFASTDEALLSQIYKRMAYELFNLPTLDMSVYSGKRGRMWRIVNRKRSNGNFKIRSVS